MSDKGMSEDRIREIENFSRHYTMLDIIRAKELIAEVGRLKGELSDNRTANGEMTLLWAEAQDQLKKLEQENSELRSEVERLKSDGHVLKLEDDLFKVDAENERLREGLKRLEWSATPVVMRGGAEEGWCPSCWSHRDNEPHKPDCWLDKLVKGEK